MSVADELIKDIPKGLLCWYDFRTERKVIQITEQEDAVTELLRDAKLEVVCISGKECIAFASNKENIGAFDYAVAIGAIEQSADVKVFLKACKSLLKKDGVFLLGTDNRLGIRYFCGDRDPYTNRNFDGIENYRRVQKSLGKNSGRAYSKNEIEAFLQESGFINKRYYSVFPNIKNPQLLYAEDYLPEEELATRILPMYNNPETVFLEEEFLYTDLVKNGLFHVMANGYLIECSLAGRFSNVKHVTLSSERGREAALMTIIRRDEKVEKRAIYKEGCTRLQIIRENAQELKKHGIQVVEGELRGNAYVMPYVRGEMAVTYLRKILYTDKEVFIKEMDRFREIILNSSKIIRKDDDGAILKYGYFDLAPINCFYVEGQYVFFDQEFVQEEYPANVMILRLVNFIYHGDFEAETILPKSFFYKRYELDKKLEKWLHMSNIFLAELKKEKELRCFHEVYRRNAGVVNSNRQKMNYSESEYRRLFIDIFRNAEGKKLILFGAGRFALKFVSLFAQDYPVHAIVDNMPEKWGQKLNDIPITSPDILKDMEKGTYKVIICIKDYTSVVKQLNELGVKDYSIYDTNIDYPRQKRVPISFPTDTKTEHKKYHIGYIAGVFDLFHVGHLNMFKRAKEQCEYLIVGVVTDEGVRNHKHVEPFIPFEERIEMVRSCKYVDEAVEIPVNYGGTRDAYRLYHFDCQFSGSDYVDNPDWLAEKMFLEKQGADMVFFPYTEGTSSTKIKKMIEKSLL